MPETLAEKAAREVTVHENTDGIFVRKHPVDPSKNQIIVLESLRGRLLNLMYR